MRVRIRLLLAAALAVAAFLIPATASAATVTSPYGCSWLAYSDPNLFNFAFPDQNATYWATALPSIPTAGLTITGSFPQARYFSFIAYDPLLRPVGGLHDSQIVPSSGVNPFVYGQSGTGSYTIHILPEDPPAKPAANTVYTGEMYGGAPNPGGIVLYRVYAPSDSISPTGGVDLPQITYNLDGLGVTMPPCTAIAGLPEIDVNSILSDSSFPSLKDPVALGASAKPTWSKSFGYSSVFGEVSPALEPLAPGGGAYLSNPDNSYIGAAIDHKYGNVVVFRARMPDFPNTTSGEAPWQPGQQVRYWSICENEKFTTRYVGCIADYQAVLRKGIATFVISDPDARPSNAYPTKGVNWLPWGDYPDGLILYRQMLAAPGFKQAVARITQGEALAPTMGAYLPQIAYCTTAEFEKAGANGCLGPFAPKHRRR
jgi:hypothetical protein